uniref:Uncharacterized protein n=1 Tax=Anguilla anguilla TaxID=7936 RepID=A0A0E9Q555_ANGAN
MIFPLSFLFCLTLHSWINAFIYRTGTILTANPARHVALTNALPRLLRSSQSKL